MGALTHLRARSRAHARLAALLQASVGATRRAGLRLDFHGRKCNSRGGCDPGLGSELGMFSAGTLLLLLAARAATLPRSAAICSVPKGPSAGRSLRNDSFHNTSAARARWSSFASTARRLRQRGGTEDARLRPAPESALVGSSGRRGTRSGGGAASADGQCHALDRVALLAFKPVESLSVTVVTSPCGVAVVTL